MQKHPNCTHTHALRAIRRALRVIAFAGACTQPALLAAQQTARADTAELHLGALYQSVQAASPRISAARALARAAESRVPSSTRPPDPQLQLGLMNRDLPSLAPMDPLGMTTLQLTQMIPVAGKLDQAGQAARARAAAATDRADDVRWDVRAKVAMAFYELYRSDRSIGIATGTRRLLQDIARTAQTMYAVGDGRQADVLRANVEIARMNEDIVRMEAMRTAMASRLDGALDRPLGATAGRPVLPAFPDSVPTLDSLQQWAAANCGRTSRSASSTASAEARWGRNGWEA